MKTIKVQGRRLRSENYCISSAIEVEEGLEVDSPSLLANLILLRRKLRRKVDYGFEYSFPMAFDFNLDTNGFQATFPIIFE